MNSYDSEACLVGKIGEKVTWEGIPSDNGEGGELKIAPNDGRLTAAGWNPTSGISNGTKVAIPGSSADSAYLSGRLDGRQQSLGTVYKYNTKLSFLNIPNTPIAIGTGNSTNASLNKTICSQEFWDNYNESSSNVICQPYKVRPEASSTNTITLKDGSTLSIPINCIWFKPKQQGTCGISFTVDNMSKTRYTSLYRYLRDPNTNLVPPRSNWDEIELLFDKSGGIAKNSTVMYYEIEIDESEVTAGYEYCIGCSTDLTTGNTEAGFVFLYLAGASINNGNVNATAMLKNLDYVYKNGSTFLPDFNSETYKPNMVLLSFSFDSDADYSMLFNMDDITDSKYVYYNTDGPGIIDSISASVTVGIRVTTTEKFPPRQET